MICQYCKRPYNPSEAELVFFSSRRRHTSCNCDWISDVCSSYLSFPVAVVTTELPVMADVPTQRGAVPPPRSEERRVGKEDRGRRGRISSSTRRRCRSHLLYECRLRCRHPHRLSWSNCSSPIAGF